MKSNSLQSTTGKEVCVCPIFPFTCVRPRFLVLEGWQAVILVLLISSGPCYLAILDRGLIVRSIIASLLSVYDVPENLRITGLQFPYCQGIRDRVDVTGDIRGIQFLSRMLSVILQEMRFTTCLVGPEGSNVLPLLHHDF